MCFNRNKRKKIKRHLVLRGRVAHSEMAQVICPLGIRYRSMCALEQNDRIDELMLSGNSS